MFNDTGHIADQCWLAIPEHFPNTILHAYTIMPNHVHGIIEITVGAKNLSPNRNMDNAPQKDVPTPNMSRKKNMPDDNMQANALFCAI